MSDNQKEQRYDKFKLESADLAKEIISLLNTYNVKPHIAIGAFACVIMSTLELADCKEFSEHSLEAITASIKTIIKEQS